MQDMHTQYSNEISSQTFCICNLASCFEALVPLTLGIVLDWGCMSMHISNETPLTSSYKTLAFVTKLTSI